MGEERKGREEGVPASCVAAVGAAIAGSGATTRLGFLAWFALCARGKGWLLPVESGLPNRKFLTGSILYRAHWKEVRFPMEALGYQAVPNRAFARA